MSSPTQRSLALLREEGWLVDVVERWIPGANIRKDLFGFGDLFAVRGKERLLVQTTSASNIASRIRKIADHENVGKVREAEIGIQVHGWAKRNGRWTVRREDLS